MVLMFCFVLLLLVFFFFFLFWGVFLLFFFICLFLLFLLFFVCLFVCFGFVWFLLLLLLLLFCFVVFFVFVFVFVFFWGGVSRKLGSGNNEEGKRPCKHLTKKGSSNFCVFCGDIGSSFPFPHFLWTVCATMQLYRNLRTRRKCRYDERLVSIFSFFKEINVWRGRDSIIRKATVIERTSNGSIIAPTM